MATGKLRAALVETAHTRVMAIKWPSCAEAATSAVMTWSQAWAMAATMERPQVVGAAGAVPEWPKAEVILVVKGLPRA